MAEYSSCECRLELYLQELKKNEFPKFKELLKEELLKLPHKSFSWTNIKKASKRVLATLLEEYFPGQEAWKVMMRLFLQVNRKDLWTKVQKDMREKSNPYKEHMKEKFQVIWRRELSVHVPEYFYRQTIMHEYRELNEIFATSAGPVTVVLRGTEGAGKSTFLRKVMLEWAEETLWKERFTFVFFFNVHEMNSMTETSLVELISRDWPESSVPIRDVFSQPQKILFILDDFEYLRFDLGLKTNLCEDWRQQQPIDVILSSLLQKKMLPESFLILAFGTMSLEQNYPLLKNPKDINFSKFSQRDIQSYFTYFFRDPKKSFETYTSVKRIPPLISSCSRPLTCWMVCMGLKRQLLRNKDFQLNFETDTTFYIWFVTNALGLRCDSQNRAQILSLCTLAVEGCWTLTFFFGDKDLRRNGITDVSFWLDLKFLQRRGDLFTFHHSALQIFCAAMYYLLRQPMDNPNPVIGSLAQLITASVTLAQPHLFEMGLYVFGLSAKKSLHMLETNFVFPLHKDLKQEVTQCLSNLSKIEEHKKVMNFEKLFQCLFEIQEKELVEEVMNHFEEVFLDIDDMDSLTICSFSMKQCQKIRKFRLRITKIFRDKSGPNPECSKNFKYWQEFWSMLYCRNALQVLELDSCELSWSYMSSLCRGLSQPTCELQSLSCNFMPGLESSSDFFKVIIHTPQLKYLSLHGTELMDCQIQDLCETLKSPRSKIEELMLGSCHITSNVCRWIALALKHSKCLKHLSLVENPLKDAGVMALCEGLRNENCVLETLMLSYCCLSNISCDLLAQALVCNKSLTILDLELNVLRDKGAASLCAALRHPDCSLQELWMSGCYLTPEACKDISAVLTCNEKLKTLKLGNNLLQDAGVKQLCKSLQHPSCKLQRLGLNMCQVTAACCAEVALALICCKTLHVLDLDKVDMGHEGVKELCQALDHQDCVLKVLGLDKSAFPESTQNLLNMVEERTPRLTIAQQPWELEEERLRGVPQAWYSPK